MFIIHYNKSIDVCIEGVYIKQNSLFHKITSYTLAITGKGYNVDTNFSKKSSYKCQAAFHFKDFVVQV